MSIMVVLGASIILGTWALRSIGLRAGGEGLVYRFLIGLSLCAVLILFVGSVSLNLALYMLYGIALVGFTVEMFRGARLKAQSTDTGPEWSALTGFEWVCVTFIGLSLLLAIVASHAPLTSQDAMTAHLALPDHFAREGRIGLWEGTPYSAYPLLAHSLYTMAYFRSGEFSAVLLGWGFAVLASVVVFGLGRRLAGRKAGLIAAAILVTTPIFADQASTVAIDLAFVAFSTAALSVLLAWMEKHEPRRLLLAAFLAGSSCGIRHTGYLVCVILALFVLVLGVKGRRLRDLAQFSGLAFLVAFPWLLRSALLVGNPFYPLFTGWFGNGGIPEMPVGLVAAHGTSRNIGLIKFLMFWWDIIMKPGQFDGCSKSPGGLVLFLGLPGLFLCGKKGRMIGLYCAIGLVCFFFFQRLARYILPFFVPMMALAGATACRLPKLRIPINVLLVIFFLFGFGLHAAAVHFKIPAALGFEDRNTYLENRLDHYRAWEKLNGIILQEAPSAVVLSLDMRSYPVNTTTYTNVWALEEITNRPISEQLAWLKQHQIRYIFVPDTCMRQKWKELKRSGVTLMVDRWASNKHFRERFETNASPDHRVVVYEVMYD